MISKNIITQIVLILFAVGIFFFYVRPVFTDIGETQDQISQYQQEIDQVSEVNDRLAQTVATANQISASDLDALTTYLPNQVDTVSVQRDLLAIVSASGLSFGNVSTAGEDDQEQERASSNAADSVNAPVPQSFSVQASGTYGQVKRFLENLASNEYQLRITQMQLEPSGGTGFMTVSLEVDAYQMPDISRLLQTSGV